MNVNERGTKKWTSIMLPEHVKMLEEMFAEQERKTKPILDEQQLLENNLTLQLAVNEDLQVEIKYYRNHDIKLTRGHLLRIDVFNKILYMKEIEISLDDVIGVSIV